MGSSIDVKEFGAIGDGVNDDTTALNAALASSTNSHLFFSPGVYRISDPLVSNASVISLEGAGNQSSIIRQTHNCAGITIGHSMPSARVSIRGMSIQTLVQSTEVGLDVVCANPGNDPSVLIEDVEVRGTEIENHWWAGGVRMRNAALPVLRDVLVIGRPHSSSTVVAESTRFGIVLECDKLAVMPVLTNCKVFWAECAFFIHSTSKPGIEGLQIVGCNGVHVKYGVYCESDYVQDYRQVQIDIRDSHFEFYQKGIFINQSNEVWVSNCLLYQEGSVDEPFTFGAEVTNCDRVFISGNSVKRCFPNQVKLIGVVVTNSARGIIRDCVVESGDAAVALTGTTTAFLVDGVQQHGPGTAAVDNSSGINRIINRFVNGQWV